MKIYLARHGRTNYNEMGLCNSDPSVDVHLTETGIAQSKILAKKLKAVAIDLVFVSELKRTQQTADIINQFHGAPIKIDLRLNDNKTGYENELVSDYYTALNKASDMWAVRFNNGESMDDVKARAKAFISELQNTSCQSVLIVTSRLLIQMICLLVKGLSEQEAWRLEVEQGSCIEFELG